MENRESEKWTWPEGFHDKIVAILKFKISITLLLD